MDKFLEVIKIFLEKHFLPALTAVVLTGVIFFFTPDNFPLLTKLEKWLYLIVVFSFCMLVIEIIIKIVHFMRQKIETSKEEKKYNDENAKKNEKFLLETVDSLSLEDRKKLDYFINNDNKPLIVAMRLRDSLFLEQFCNINEFELKESAKVMDPFSLKKDVELKKGSRATRYRLKDDFYNEFKNIKKKNNKISNFD